MPLRYYKKCQTNTLISFWVCHSKYKNVTKQNKRRNIEHMKYRYFYIIRFWTTLTNGSQLCLMKSCCLNIVWLNYIQLKLKLSENIKNFKKSFNNPKKSFWNYVLFAPNKETLLYYLRRLVFDRSSPGHPSDFKTN